MSRQAAGDPPRVLLVSRIFAPEPAAASFRLSALVAALRRQGADVEVLTSTAPPGSRVEDHRDTPGARVRRWPVLRDAAGYVRGYLPYVSFDLPLVLRLALTRRPDVVVVEPPPTTGAVVRAVLALRGGLGARPIPYVYYAADIWSDATASTGAPWAVVTVLRVLERYAVRGARQVVAVSDGVAHRVGELGRAPERIAVVPNGIDTDVFTTDGPLAEAAPVGTPYLMYAGTASEWQGAEVFARAMPVVLEQVPGARVVFLGQGSSWPRLRELADALPDGAIGLVPLVSPGEAASWLRGAAAALVSVRPGLGYDLAYPTKVIAALACGTPVLFTGPGPVVADLADHDLGEAVPYAEPEVAAAMVRALRAGLAPVELRERRRSWVVAHRSVRATGARAATLVLAVRADPLARPVRTT